MIIRHSTSFITKACQLAPGKQQMTYVNHVRCTCMFIAATVCLQLMLLQRAAAQVPRVSNDRLGMDVVQLQDKTRVYGFVLNRSESATIHLAVSREWLRDTHSDLYREYSVQEEVRLDVAKKELVSRINAWIEERKADTVLIAFLESELARIQASSVEDQMQARFIVLRIPEAEARNIFLQSGPNKKMAGLAFQFRLDDVVSTPVEELEKQLREKGIDPDDEILDLRDDVPSWQEQSERQWLARKALVEYQLRQPLEYQGTGIQLFRKSGEQVDVAKLLTSIRGNGSLDAVTQLGAELGLPEFQQFARKRSAQWWRQAVREAERDEFIGVLATRLDQGMLSNNVSVETVFLAKAEAGSWFPVFKMQATESTSNQSQDRLDQIREDPQVRQVLNAVSALGIGLDNRIDLALRHGAATEQAMSRATGAFNSFLADNIRSLDGPPVIVEQTKP